EPDHPVAVVHQQIDETLPPGDQLRADAHDEEHHLPVLGPAHVVVELDVTVACGGHGDTVPSAAHAPARQPAPDRTELAATSHAAPGSGFRRRSATVSTSHRCSKAAS